MENNKKTLEELFKDTKVEKIEVKEELEKSFLSYAMAVNVSRAIPDVRDGLKPVHRRILFGMGEQGLFSDHKYTKSARIVGDVMGKFHPHGDSALYDAMVRLAQNFSIRHPLIDGQGNFGSVDGDGAAAMRYTEARLSKISDLMLEDLDCDTVDFYPNYDDTLMQPTVLTAKFPNLLVNGSDGIAVGMATNIPPHNLSEVCSGVQAIIRNPEIEIDDLIKIIPSPDFPTGGIVMGRSATVLAYKTGRGGIVVRGRAEIEELSNGRSRIVITELPYQVNKSKFIIQVADQVKDKKLEGISDIKEESDREGMRVVIDIKKDANAQVVLNTLYKQTQLQVSDGLIFLALVRGEPKICNLKEMLSYYLEHQIEVTTRKAKFDLKKAEERMHIVQGLIIAVSNIDEVVKIIKESDDRSDAMQKLIQRFALDEIQVSAILDMKLSKLTGLEVDRLKKEMEDLETTIADLNDILRRPERVLQMIDDQMENVKVKFGEPRRTTISIDYGDINIADLIEREDVVLSMTHMGYIKRMSLDEYRSQHRGGVGISAHKTKEEDFVDKLFITNTHNDLLFFTNFGRVYSLKAYEVPEAQRQAKGRAIINLLQLNKDEKVNAIIPLNEGNRRGNLVMATRNGLIKKTNLREFDNIRKVGKIAIKLNDDDQLIGVELSDDDHDILIASSSGKCIRFNERNVRPMGRATQGVRSMRLSKTEKIVDMCLIKEGSQIITISSNGYGKRTSEADYRRQSRGGKGVKAGVFNAKTGSLVELKQIDDGQDIMIIANNGVIIRLSSNDINVIGRATQGVKVMRLRNDAEVVCVATVPHEEQETDLIEETIIENIQENADNKEEKE